MTWSEACPIYLSLEWLWSGCRPGDGKGLPRTREEIHGPAWGVKKIKERKQQGGPERAVGAVRLGRNVNRAQVTPHRGCCLSWVQLGSLGAEWAGKQATVWGSLSTSPALPGTYPTCISDGRCHCYCSEKGPSSPGTWGLTWPPHPAAHWGCFVARPLRIYASWSKPVGPCRRQPQ